MVCVCCIEVLALLCECMLIFIFKENTAYVMRISDWISDVFSSVLPRRLFEHVPAAVIGLDRLREFDEDRLDPEMMDEPHHILDADKGNEGERRGDGRHDVSPTG